VALPDFAGVGRLGRVLASAGAVVLVAGCGASPSGRLAKDLIPIGALEAPAWGLRAASKGRTLNPFGVATSGTPIAVSDTAQPAAAATRQWVHGSGAIGPGPLPDGVFTVIDRAAHFRSASEADAFVADLSRGYGSDAARPVAGTAGATLSVAPFTSRVPGGLVTGHEDLVVIARGGYVFTVLVVGGGTRPSASDAQAVAALQAAAIPDSLR
jgi:hypothetical protein